MKIRFPNWSMALVVSGLALASLALPGRAVAETLMSAGWAEQACAAWNNEPILTGKLLESGWVTNDTGRGYKVIQLYRTDCGADSRVEMQIAAKEQKAMCIYGGVVQTPELDSGADYVMHATTTRWQEMGKGEYGPMRAMLFRRLKFSGPKFEAMKNMGPFKQFLLLTGSVSGDMSSCPG
ncbi:MAG: SCP2 sterol-binding domain-containing protein [Gammaproteobacteria bacterium]|nr:SCP2 sterol-binding domain-containing protein [Gammaproteobacteria bacterium]